MALTAQEKKDLIDLVTQMYKGKVTITNPTEETLRLVEKVFVESEKCNKAISKLLTDLPIELLTRGTFRRHLGKIRKIVKKQQFDFEMCASNALRNFKSPIAISAS